MVAVDPGFRAQTVLCMRDIPRGENGGPNPCEEWVVMWSTLQSDRGQDKGTTSAINKEGLDWRLLRLGRPNKAWTEGR